MLGLYFYSAGVVAPLCLEKYDPSKLARGRSIKVALSQSGLVHEVLRSSRKLKNSDRFRGIFIPRNRTPMQIAYFKSMKQSLDERIAEIAYFKSMKQSLDERIAAGESDIVIKFVGYVPRIVSTKSR
ncbi:hypothetical protein QE152_g1690 [Popillia japonica]|uniref:Uncharacterized protein n=1 Tax=Popillia japonica TaxID=7064 RepID=A0AAW1N4X2_POPJA